MKNLLRSSLTRLAHLEEGRYRVDPVPRMDWGDGDLMVAEVTRPPGKGVWVELVSGRQTHVGRGDQIMGALGVRHATLEITGTWEAVGEDGFLHLLTAAGLFGKLTSLSHFCVHPIEAVYVGHVTTHGKIARMRDFVPKAPAGAKVPEWRTPTIMIVGSSMSAGKTSAARNIIRRLKKMDLNVVAGKITGAGRFRDILTMGDAGADWTFDFVEAGMPSTICPADEYLARTRDLLGRVAQQNADVAVIEAGASPLEPYNGEAAVALLGENVRLMVLCASDPYSVIGIQKAFGSPPDVVGGAAANTIAGRELVSSLTGLPTLDFTAGESQADLDSLLIEKLGL